VETIMQAERFIDKIFYVYFYKIKYPTRTKPYGVINMNIGHE
jgi:hypothetical protein